MSPRRFPRSAATLAVLTGSMACGRSPADDAAFSAPRTSVVALDAAANDAGPNDAGRIDQDAGSPSRFDPEEGERVLQSVNRLPLMDKACKRRRCSLTLDNDGEHWVVAVGSDRSPAPLAPLHLFSVLVVPGSEQVVGVSPGAMYGFCVKPISVENWARYSVQYERYLDDKGPEPACP